MTLFPSQRIWIGWKWRHVGNRENILGTIWKFQSLVQRLMPASNCLLCRSWPRIYRSKVTCVDNIPSALNHCPDWRSCVHVCLWGQKIVYECSKNRFENICWRCPPPGFKPWCLYQKQVVQKRAQRENQPAKVLRQKRESNPPRIDSCREQYSMQNDSAFLLHESFVWSNRVFGQREHHRPQVGPRKRHSRLASRLWQCLYFRPKKIAFF